MIGPIWQSWCDDCEEDVETQDRAEVDAFNRRHDHSGCSDTCAPPLYQFCSPECETAFQTGVL